jgi:hypothetical protein
MERMDNVRERIEALEQQMTIMGAHTRAVERRLRGWRGLAYSMVLLSLLSLGLPAGHAADFACATGAVACLIDALNQANANGEANTITLEAGTYTLTAVDNTTDGPNGLPSVTGVVTIQGAGADATILERDDNAPEFRLVHAAATGVLTLDGLTLRGGATFSRGAGLFNRGTLAILHTTLRDHLVFLNGPAALANMGTATIHRSTIVNNHAQFISGDIGNFGGTVLITNTTFANNSSEGSGAIDNASNNSGGTVVISDSTFLCNRGDGGGAIENGETGTVLVTNSTLARNFNGVGVGGGGIFNAGTMVVTNTTLARNFNGFGIDSRGTTILQNTILALNTGESGRADCGGVVTSLGNNLIGDPTGCTITLQPSDLTGDPGLDTFTDDGTPGHSHFPLLPSSQAIDAGNDAACPKTDQLGAPRVGPCDIGAIEFQGKHRKLREPS